MIHFLKAYLVNKMYKSKPIIYNPDEFIEINQGNILKKIVKYLNKNLPIGNSGSLQDPP